MTSEDRRGAWGAFLTLFGILAAHTLLETTRDALFLASIPVTHLPFVYLTVAALTMVATMGRARLFPGSPRAHSLNIFLLSSALVTLGFWLLADSQGGLVLYGLYIWSALFGTVALVLFWLRASERYTASQAKRVFGFIGAGAVLGAMGGAGIALLLTRLLETQHLLLGVAAILMLTGVGRIVSRRREQSGGGGRLTAAMDCTLDEGIRSLRRDSYLKKVLLLALLSTIALTLIDYLFKSVVVEKIPAEDFGFFFAGVSTALNTASLLFQLFAVGWLLRLLGVHRVLAVLPFLIILSGGGFLVGGGIIAVLAMKGADGALRHSLHRTSAELLFVPVKCAVRNLAKPFIDVVGQRGGQAIASFAILIAVNLGLGQVELVTAVLLLAVAWMVTALKLKEDYIENFRENLREGHQAPMTSMPALDLGALETLFSALNSRDDGEVIGAMELLAEQNRVGLIPGMILHHPARAVVLRALELFSDAGRDELVPIVERVLGNEDVLIRVAALRFLSVSAPNEEGLRSALSDESQAVRATALVGLIGNGWSTETGPDQALSRLLERAEPEIWLEAARAVRAHPSERLVQPLIMMADHPDVQVRSEAAGAMGALRLTEFTPALIRMLTHRRLRRIARKTLVSIGEPALDEIDAAFDDNTLPAAIRRHLPRTVSRFKAGAAARILLKHLPTADSGIVQEKILRGLGRLRTDNPGLHLDMGLLQQATDRTLSDAYRFLDWRLQLERGIAKHPRRSSQAQELLTSLLSDKEQHAIARLFRLLGLLTPSEDWKRIYDGLQSSVPSVRSSSQELFEYALDPSRRESVLGLVAELDDRERGKMGDRYHSREPLTYEGVLLVMLEQGSESLRSLTAYHIGELGLNHLRERLEQLQQATIRETKQNTDHGFLGEVIERALATLDSPHVVVLNGL